MRFSTFALAALPALAVAAPAGTPTNADAASYATDTPAPETTPYTVMALRSASPIHFRSLNAAGRAFYLGGETASYCPELDVEGFVCPPGNQTVFIAPYNGLSTLVPGGQQVYVEPSGALGFTQAHSAAYPAGSVLNPITYTPVEGAAYSGQISTTAFGANGFIACPTSTGAYQVFANFKTAQVPSGNISDCLGFSAVTVAYNGPQPAAWQYT